jgi:AmmeMemoRadiSam system protein B
LTVDRPVIDPLTDTVRNTVFAGRFYPDDPATARREVTAYLAQAVQSVAKGREAPGEPAARRPVGGIVPHAGWVCSAAIAAATLARLAEAGGVQVVVVFAAIHTPVPSPRGAVLDRHARWAIPGGAVDVAVDLRERLLAEPGGLLVADDRFHDREHAVEVELPLIAAAFPGAQVLPVEVPVNDAAVAIGQSVAATVATMGLSAIYLASTDLTHYGPGYGFTPAGVGPAGLEWAKQNDRRLLDLVCNMAAGQIVPHVRQHRSACGAGAIAAMLAAAASAGATAGQVLRHASSYQTLASVAPQPPVDAVGYAAVVVG